MIRARLGSLATGLVVLATACGPTDAQRASLRAWYDCIDCDAGELDTLVARADWRVLPELARGLTGPSEEELSRATARLRAERALIGPEATVEGAFVSSLLSNFIAQRQRRAAAALGGIEGPLSGRLARRALRNALAREAAYRDDVQEAIRSALVDTIEKVNGDGQTDSAWRPVPVRPRVRARTGADPMAGVEVRFSVTAGGGRVEGHRQRTDSTGEAAVSAWIIGEGHNQLVARAGNDSAVFTATGLPATQIVVDSGFPTAVRFDSWVVPRVHLLSAAQQPVGGQMVRFIVLQGGRVLCDSTRTDATGGASPRGWLVDSGSNVLAVRATGFPDLEVRVWGLPTRGP
jgi:hypothetical protein